MLHFQLEPVNATAFKNDDGVWEIHTGNQWQSLIQPTLAKALDAEPNQIIMRTYMLGGGFGRRCRLRLSCGPAVQTKPPAAFPLNFFEGGA